MVYILLRHDTRSVEGQKVARLGCAQMNVSDILGKSLKNDQQSIVPDNQERTNLYDAKC